MCTVLLKSFVISQMTQLDYAGRHSLLCVLFMFLMGQLVTCESEIRRQFRRELSIEFRTDDVSGVYYINGLDVILFILLILVSCCLCYVSRLYCCPQSTKSTGEERRSLL